MLTITQPDVLFFWFIPVVDSTGSQVCVENSDHSRCCVSQYGIINDIQKVDQLQHANRIS